MIYFRIMNNILFQNKSNITIIVMSGLSFVHAGLTFAIRL